MNHYPTATRYTCVAGLALLAATLSGCGQTYVDTSITVPATESATKSATMAPSVTYDTAVAVPELLDQIKVLMADLDERIIDEHDPTEALNAIDALWAAARPQIDAVDSVEAEDFDQAIALARSGVTARRPADASKGYKIYLTLLNHYQPG